MLDTSDFPPRWQCGTWSATLGWTHIVADLMIFGAYAAIPLVLAFFIRKRSDIPFPRIFWLFCAFIFACGVGHLIEAAIFWWPVYRLAGLSKVVTAVVSWVTVLALLPIVPKFLNLPNIATINEALKKEVAERQAAERTLREQADALKHVNQELERFNKVTIGREQRILELKDEVNHLAELGHVPKPYKSVSS